MTDSDLNSDEELMQEIKAYNMFAINYNLANSN